MNFPNEGNSEGIVEMIVKSINGSEKIIPVHWILSDSCFNRKHVKISNLSEACQSGTGANECTS